MSIRHLDSLLDPASVAVFGASLRPGSVGATVWRNLNAGFKGRIYGVNPKHASLDGVALFTGVAALPEAPELAVICTPPATVPGLIAELGARGTRAAVVITAGLDATQKQAMLDAARPYLLPHHRTQHRRPDGAARSKPERQFRARRRRRPASIALPFAVRRHR